MAVIRILPEHLSNKIAAGEVVERPASVVKELVENAIDAGASAIFVEIQNGGRSLIRVTDNGSGMGKDDALLCLERYATSKIADEKSLFAISTLGFRGEAIPSIASVSEFVLTSRPAHADAGTRIRVSGGTITDVADTGVPPGTTVAVGRLFFNTPARRKFLKAVATETGHIADTLAAFALCRPDIHFKLVQDGRTVKNWPRTVDPLERVTDVLGSQTRGHMAPISYTDDTITISGWTSSPAVTRSTSQKIHLFVNGRIVKDRGLQYALFEGYRGRLVKGAFPVAAIFINIPFDRVDVNVHPTKNEVRFADQRRVYQALKTAVAGAWAINPAPPWNDGQKPSRPKQSFSLPGVRPTPNVSESVFQYATPLPRPPFADAGDGPPAPVRPGLSGDTVPRPLETPGGSDGHQTAFRFADLAVVGQAFNTYIICQAGTQVVLIDQHAAHERILFEALKHQGRTRPPSGQNLLVPETVELSHTSAAAIEPLLEAFAAIGLEIEPFGPTAFVIKAVPAVLSDVAVGPMVAEIAEKQADTGFAPDPGTLTDDVLHVMACHAAIRAHQRLSEAEIRALLERLDGCDNPRHCPHGRPTAIFWSINEIEKAFKRIV